jgi:hypothetical protein
MTDEMDETKQTAPASRSRRSRRAPKKPPAQEAPAPVSQEETPSRLPGQLDLLAGMAGTTSRIVNRAASILEEELAAGIGVTQTIEQKYMDVAALRAADSQAVIQRFRKDAHDVVDILIDLVNAATNTLGGLSERAVSIGLGQPRKAAERGAGGAIPSLAVPTVAKPGEAVEIPMTLENESDKPTEAFYFHSSDLVNTTGERISAQQISFSPERLVIEPRKVTTVTVLVRVPDDASPGIYSGLLQATRMDQLRAVLSIQIG